jgi:hypothetical protein
VVEARRRLIVTNHRVVNGVDVVLVGFPILKDGRVVNDKRSYFDGVDLITVIDRSPRRDLALIQLATGQLAGVVEADMPDDRATAAGRWSTIAASWSRWSKDPIRMHGRSVSSLSAKL